MISNFVRGHTLLSVLVALSMLSTILLLGQTWLNQQQQQNAQLWQVTQALQIAENQQTLRLLEQPCESQIVQNGIHFLIRCEADFITVQYPLGEIRVRG